MTATEAVKCLELMKENTPPKVMLHEFHHLTAQLCSVGLTKIHAIWDGIDLAMTWSNERAVKPYASLNNAPSSTGMQLVEINTITINVISNLLRHGERNWHGSKKQQHIWTYTDKARYERALSLLAEIKQRTKRIESDCSELNEFECFGYKEFQISLKELTFDVTNGVALLWDGSLVVSWDRRHAVSVLKSLGERLEEIREIRSTLEDFQRGRKE